MGDGRIWPRIRRTCVAAGIAVAGAVLCLKSSHGAEVSPVPERLLPMFADLEAQFHLAYDSSPPAYRDRIQYTLAVIEAWQASGRTARDEALLEGWVHDALDRSLPGRRARLAPLPAFTRPGQIEAAEPAAGPDPPDRTGETLPPPEPRRQAAVSPPAPAEDLDHAPAIAVRPEPTRISPPSRRPPRAPIATNGPSTAAGISTTDEPVATATAVEHPAESPLPGPSHPPRWEARLSPPSPAAHHATLAIQAAADHVELVVPEPEERSAHAIRAINLNEYTARLVGHRMGVRRLEARMLELDAPTAEQLARLVGELEALHNQALLLAMYTDLLPGEVRGTYGPPVSAADAAAVLRKLIQSRQMVLADQATTTPVVAGGHEATLLNILSAKVAGIAGSLADNRAGNR